MKKFLIPLAAATAFAGSSAQAAVINLTDLVVTPNGTTTVTGQSTNVQTANGGNKILRVANGTERAYVVTTFNFGTGTLANIGVGFDSAFTVGDTAPNRMGTLVRDSGTNNFTIAGGSTQPALSIGALAGTSITILMKYDYDVNRTAANADDTVVSFWINPTGSSLESAPDLVSNKWNSSEFIGLVQYVQNDSTPGTAGDSSITDTTLLTLTDATFANALALATIPEPSAALLGGLGLLALLRRRR
ncbi:hypothetical protein HZ994_08330 [Akkermansiaceae bacterium]|nr:hypothetical protein HZ994_08330 [Akkermansiaceae bacterium]